MTAETLMNCRDGLRDVFAPGFLGSEPRTRVNCRKKNGPCGAYADYPAWVAHLKMSPLLTGSAMLTHKACTYMHLDSISSLTEVVIRQFQGYGMWQVFLQPAPLIAVWFFKHFLFFKLKKYSCVLRQLGPLDHKLDWPARLQVYTYMSRSVATCCCLRCVGEKCEA